MNLSKNTKQQFLSVMAGDISIPSFEEWVYDTKTLRNELGEEAYLELLEFN